MKTPTRKQQIEEFRHLQDNPSNNEEDWLIEALITAEKRENERIEQFLTSFDRPNEPPYALTAWDDRESFRNHILKALNLTKHHD